VVYVLSYRSTRCGCGLEGLPPSKLGTIDIVAPECVRTYGDELDDPFRRTPLTRSHGRHWGLWAQGNTAQHLNAALEIASSFNWHGQLFWVHYSLTQSPIHEGRPDDANAHLKHAKSHTINNTHNLGCGTRLRGQCLVHTVQAGRGDV